MTSAIIFHDGDSPDTYVLLQNDDLERTTRALSRLVEDGASLDLDIVGDHHPCDLVFDDRGFLCDVDLPGGLERVYVLDRLKTCNIFIYSQSERRVTSIMPYYGLPNGSGKWNSMAFDISVPGHVIVFSGRDVENVGWFPSIVPEGQVRLGEFWLVVDPWA